MCSQFDLTMIWTVLVLTMLPLYGQLQGTLVFLPVLFLFLVASPFLLASSADRGAKLGHLAHRGLRESHVVTWGKEKTGNGITVWRKPVTNCTHTAQVRLVAENSGQCYCNCYNINTKTGEATNEVSLTMSPPAELLFYVFCSSSWILHPV